MEVKKNKKYHSMNYVDGSAVRKLQPMPDREERGDVVRRRKQQPSRKSKQRRKPAMSFFSFVMVTVAIGITLYAAVQYLEIQTDLHNMNKEVASLQNQLVALTSENDAALNKINSKIDLEQVFQTAVNELGMVFPNSNKIITYEGAVSDYVRQFNKIPQATASDLLERLQK